MSKKLTASCLAVAVAGVVSCCAFLSACEKKPEPAKHEVVTRYSADTRAEQFGFYMNDGELVQSFKDMYKAIETCVEEGDYDDYVAKIGTNEKLFVLKEYWDGSTTDQYFYYENGTSLDRYTPWKNTYHTDLGTLSKNDIVVLKSAKGLEPYSHGHEVVAIGSQNNGGILQSWNVYPFTDASVQVDLPAYVGITKVVYNIKLSEAQIYPTYEGYDTTYAKVGFVIPDALLVAHLGIAADVNTGEWYFYHGNAEGDLFNDTYNEISDYGVLYDLDQSLFSSTWNEEGGYYSPDHDITMTAEIVPVQDGDDEYDEYFIYRVTLALDDGTEIVREYENAKTTACATMRFFAALDVFREEGMPSYDNGAQFKNLKITSAKGTVFERSLDEGHYGGNVIELDVGEYDLLNSNPESPARFQTYIYNTVITSYDFSTAGQDIYNFSYRLNNNAETLSTKIKAAKDAIEKIPAVDSITAADKATIEAARTAVDALVETYQTGILSVEFTGKDYLGILTAAEAKLASLA